MEDFRPIKEMEFRESEAVSVGAHTAGILVPGDWCVSVSVSAWEHTQLGSYCWETGLSGTVTQRGGHQD